MRLRYLAAGWTTLALAAASLIVSTPAAHAATLPSTATVWNAWNDSFLYKGGGDTYYTSQLLSKGHGRAWMWEGALDIVVAEDNYDRTQSAADRQLVSDLETTWIKNEGTAWTSWDTWNDDIGWAMTSALRAYQITGNKTWLNVVTDQWNKGYDRGWTTADATGGIWEDQNNKASRGKCALSNDPFISVGVQLYQITGDSSYLTKSKSIYSWVRSKLVNTSSGQIYGCVVWPNGLSNTLSTQKSDNAYDAGAFIEAANDLYRVTKDATYYNDAKRTADHFKNNVAIPANTQLADGSYQYWLFKGINDFCVENNLCGTYDAYMQSNAAQAWSERDSLNLTWNNWKAPTTDTNPSAFETEGMVGLFEVLGHPATINGNGSGTGGGTTTAGQVKSGIAGKCLDLTGANATNGTPVELWSCNDSSAQSWSAGSSTLQILGKCLDAIGMGTANGTKVDAWDCNGGSNQVWQSYNGGYRNPASGRCLDDPGNSATDGTQLELWDCNGGPGQQWSTPTT